MENKKRNKRSYKNLFNTDRKEYFKLASREFREANPDYYDRYRTKPKDEAKVIKNNIFDELPNDTVPIPDFPTYYARPNGEVWRDTRNIESSIKNGKARVFKLKATFNKHNNYWLVQPYRNRKKTALHVHRLILLTFKGPSPEEGMECHHIDGNTSNNCIDNLMWVTRQQNINFAKPGRKKGIPNKQSKWSKYKGVVVKLWLSGIRPVDIADTLNIPAVTVYYLINKFKVTQEDINNLKKRNK